MGFVARLVAAAFGIGQASSQYGPFATSFADITSVVTVEHITYYFHALEPKWMFVFAVTFFPAAAFFGDSKG